MILIALRSKKMLLIRLLKRLIICWKNRPKTILKLFLMLLISI